jgi:Tol biopolymer transport system component
VSRCAALVALAVGLVLAPSDSPAALDAFPGRNGLIVFVSKAEGFHSDQLFTVGGGGGRVRQLTADPPGVWGPASWSPDGRVLAYGNSYPAADVPEHLPGAPRMVAPDVYGPSWSPDGRTVVGTAGETNALVVTVDTETQASKTIYVDEGTGWPDLNDPAWSPNGRFIAFTSGYRGETFASVVLCEVRAHPTIRREDIRVFAAGSSPAWSPDGQRIAFEHRRSVLVKELVGRTSGRRIARNASDPAWSPDGRKIVFARRVSPTNTELFVMNADGSHQRRLTFRPGNDLSPDWQPLRRKG